MKNLKSVLLGGLLGLYTASPVWAVNIADVPLFQSVVVPPNVMLLVDNSGSMNNIIQADAALQGAFPDVGWFLRIGGVDVFTSDMANANLRLTTLQSNGCASGFKALRDQWNANQRCYLLPDPVGSGETRYTAKYLAYIYATYTSNNNDLTLLSDAVFPKTTRMQVARAAAKSIVQSNRAMRIGLSTFNPPVSQGDQGPGGSITSPIESLSAGAGVTQVQADLNFTTLNSSIDALAAVANTPLAESYYEVTRYFRGMSRYQGSGAGNYTSPIRYRCQRNFGVVITDGLPTRDSTFPSDDPQAVNSLPDWDGVGTGRPITEQYSDGPGGNDAVEGNFLYLDDIAKFAHDIDFRTTGTDSAGVSYNDPSFTKQNLATYSVGFSIDNQMLRDAAVRGSGEYYTANNAGQLNSVLSSALQSIRERTSSAAAIATNSTRLDTDTLIYQARFNSGDWSGELIAYALSANGALGNISWRTSNAGLIPEPSSRNVFTYNGAAGVPFTWSNLSAVQKTALEVPAEADGPVVVNWLRGGNSGAMLSNAERLRERSAVLGDIINSDPIFVGAQNYGYTVPNNPLVTTEPADTYQAYLDTKSLPETPKLLMVGANDGMLHAFNAQTGAEMFAYVPFSIYKARTTSPGTTPGLRYLTKANYRHKYFVDGPIGTGDVYVDGAWKTYAVGGLGAGGRGIFGLNITTPASFSGSDVLWEVTAPDTNDANSNWNDLGYTYGLPVIARTQDDTWVAIFSNGYGSNTGKSALYVVNAKTGALIKKIIADPTGTDSANGLSAPAVMVDSNRRVTYVYAGDLKGNVWKFDLTSTTSSAWDVFKKTSGNLAVPLFVAKDSAGAAQPITSGLEIGAHPTSGGLMVYFGTGKYFETTDNTVGTNPQMQSFYGVWDKPVSGNSLNGWEITDAKAESLLRQRITDETNDYRVFSKTVVDWSAKRGWFMDLGSPGTGTATIAAGERAVSLPLLRAGRIIFTTVIPSSDPCLAGGTSWLMELDAFTGGNLNYAVLDINGDGEFNSADKIVCAAGQCDPGGLKSREGIIKTPGIVSAGDTEYKYSGGSSGNVLVITEKGSVKEGRMSWRQLR